MMPAGGSHGLVLATGASQRRFFCPLTCAAHTSVEYEELYWVPVCGARLALVDGRK
jgi:hypothetical protein